MAVERRSLRSVRDLALRWFRTIDDFLEPRLHPRRHPRLVFDGSTPFEFAMFRPVYERLRSDPRIEIFFTSSQLAKDPLVLYQPFGIPADRILS